MITFVQRYFVWRLGGAYMLPNCQAAFVLRHFSTKPPSRSLDSPIHEGNMIMLAESETWDFSRPSKTRTGNGIGAWWSRD
jgi:hypothetical protein